MRRRKLPQKRQMAHRSFLPGRCRASGARWQRNVLDAVAAALSPSSLSAMGGEVATKALKVHNVNDVPRVS